MLIACAGLTCAGDVEWWQATDVSLFSREKISAVIHTQMRVRDGMHDLFYGRIGPVVRIPVGPRWVVTGGYYFGEAEREASDWRNNHRTWAALARPIPMRKGSLTLRATAEHHFGGGNPQDRRFRQLLMWRHRAPLSPYWGTETFLDRSGFLMQRLQGGVRRSLGIGYSLDVGYIYDMRVDRAGGARHVIQTAIKPEPREK